MGDPELLILDEPTNGMDPAGMAEVRDLIRSLGSEGRTVLISSHLLNEVEQVCDSVAIISKGRLVVQGDVADLLHPQEQVRLRTTDDAKALAILTAADDIESAKAENEALVVTIRARTLVRTDRAAQQVRGLRHRDRAAPGLAGAVLPGRNRRERRTARMTSQVLSLTRLEWYKLRHRRMPWILLGIAVLLVQVAFWGSYALFRSGPDDGRRSR